MAGRAGGFCFDGGEGVGELGVGVRMTWGISSSIETSQVTWPIATTAVFLRGSSLTTRPGRSYPSRGTTTRSPGWIRARASAMRIRLLGFILQLGKALGQGFTGPFGFGLGLHRLLPRLLGLLPQLLKDLPLGNCPH